MRILALLLLIVSCTGSNTDCDLAAAEAAVLTEAQTVLEYVDVVHSFYGHPTSETIELARLAVSESSVFGINNARFDAIISLFFEVGVFPTEEVEAFIGCSLETEL